MEDNAVQILLSREQSSMVSTWDEQLGLVQVAEKIWKIGIFAYQWIGSIYELIPESQRYSDDGELLVPSTWDGKKIIGIADGEYLQTDELVTSDYLEFSASALKKARDFCQLRGWSAHPKFDLAWLHVETSVKPSGPLSKRRAFKGMPLLKAGSSASLGGYCMSELAIYRGQLETEFWVWNSESESECLYRAETVLSFTEIVRTVAEDESFSVEINWHDLDVSGLCQSEGIILASAWAFDEGSKAAATLISKIPVPTLLPLLRHVTLDGIELQDLGQRLLDYATDHDISLDDIKSIRPRQLSDVKGLEKSLIGATSRVARRQARADSAQQQRLSTFELDIDRLIEAYRKAMPKRYYPGAGYIVPPLGVHSLRQFLKSYVLQHQALPTGTVHVPYDEKEMGKPSHEFFAVDFDALAHQG